MKNPFRVIHRFFHRLRLQRAYSLLRRNGYVTMSQGQLVGAIMECKQAERKLVKMGGGNLSKIRDVRKSMRRLTIRFRGTLTKLDQARIQVDG